MIFFLLWACSLTASQEPFRRFVEKVECYDEFLDITGEPYKYTQFLLSDGTVWYLSKLDPKIGTEPFPIGTEVFISHTLEPYLYRVEYLLNDEMQSLIAKIHQKSHLKFPTLTDKKKIVVQRGGWFTSDTYAYLFELSDGSLWQIEKQDLWKRDMWNIGDKVLISPKRDFSAWEIINISDLYYSHVPYELLNPYVQVKPLK